MKNCEKCSFEIQESWNYCPKCSQKIGEILTENKTYETDWNKVHINEPISFYDKSRFEKHKKFLNEKVFPALDELTGKALIYNYHILHGFDLRFKYAHESKLNELREVLNKHGITERIEDYPGDTPERLKILKLNTDIARLIVNQAQENAITLLDECQHYQAQSLGLNSEEEVKFNLSRTIAWYAQVNYGTVSPETIKKTKEYIMLIIQKFDVLYYFRLIKGPEKAENTAK